MKPLHLSQYIRTLLANRRGTYLLALWLALGGLLIFAVVFVGALLWSHQSGEEQQRVEEAAQAVGASMHRTLSRNLQDVGGLAGLVKDEVMWRQTATSLLKETRAVLRVERRDANLSLLEAADSPFEPPMFRHSPRFKSEAQAIDSCTAASGPGLPVYSKTYFVPLGSGRGIEVVDLCAAHQVDGKTLGFTVETIGLNALLESSMADDMVRFFEASIIEGSNVRLARGGMAQGAGVYRAERVVALPGISMRVRVESARGSPQFKLNFVFGLAMVVLLLLAVVIAFIVREILRRGAEAAKARMHQEKLQSAARVTMVGEVASLISHEINQPLQSIVAWAHTALRLGERTQLPPDLIDILQQMYGEATRGAKVVKSVRDYVSGSQVEHEAVDMRTLVDGIRPIVEQLSRDYGTRLIESEFPAAPLMVICDKVMIEQVILNLVKNALQAMQRNPAHVPRLLKISVRRMGDGRVRVSVSDTGPGASEQLIQRVAHSEFKSFQKVSSEGLGLGLSLCRSVMQSHKGTLSVANRNNRRADTSRAFEGATFSFTLPRAPLAETEESTNARELHYEHANPTAPGSLFS